MIDDILDARRPSVTEFLVRTGAGRDVTLKQQIAQMDLSLDGLQVVRTYTVKTGDVAVRIQAHLTLLSGNLFTFKTGTLPEIAKISEPGLMTLSAGPTDELTLEVDEYPRLKGTIDQKTFEFLTGYIEAGHGSMSGTIDVQLDGVHVDEVAPGDDLTYLLQAKQPVKVLEVLEVSVATPI